MKKVLLASLLMFSTAIFANDCYNFGIGDKPVLTPYKLCLDQTNRTATVSETNSTSNMMLTKCIFNKTTSSYSSKLVDSTSLTIFKPLIVVCENNVLIALDVENKPGKLVFQNIRFTTAADNSSSSNIAAPKEKDNKPKPWE